MLPTGVERRVVLLKRHIRFQIAQSCHLFLALISLPILELHKFYKPGSCSKPPLVKIRSGLVQISALCCTTDEF